MAKYNRKIIRIVEELLGEKTGGSKGEKMKKEDKLYKELGSMLKSLKRASKEPKSKSYQLVDAAHQLLSRQLETLKARHPNKTGKGVIVFDSRMLPLPDGVRPASVETGRLRFRIGEKHLELAIYPISPDSYELIGQVGGLKEDKILKIQLSQGKKKAVVKSNEIQVFRFQRVLPGKSKLELYDRNENIGQIDFEI